MFCLCFFNTILWNVKCKLLWCIILWNNWQKKWNPIYNKKFLNFHTRMNYTLIFIYEKFCFMIFQVKWICKLSQFSHEKISHEIHLKWNLCLLVHIMCIILTMLLKNNSRQLSPTQGNINVLYIHSTHLLWSMGFM